MSAYWMLHGWEDRRKEGKKKEKNDGGGSVDE
jgi:hypothetical protein